MDDKRITFRIDDKLFKLLENFSHESKSEIIIKALRHYIGGATIKRCPKCKGTGIITIQARKKGRFT